MVRFLDGRLASVWIRLPGQEFTSVQLVRGEGIGLLGRRRHMHAEIFQLLSLLMT
jgi:hypothetical protein